ncbi:MAG TPA: carbamate kinase [Thermoplasmata archaeon]|nr:carbamate kinase [Thermoplasmata archaeon]
MSRGNARAVVALGGNALQPRGGDGSWAASAQQLRRGVPALVEIVAAGASLVLTHGNGPQVGRLLEREDRRPLGEPGLPLDALVAESEGQLGLLIAQELTPALSAAGQPRIVLPIVSRIEVDPKDPAFRRPDKPVGRFYAEDEARVLRKRRGWTMGFDEARRGWRRLIPSPRPIRWLEAEAVRRALARAWAGRVIPIVAGGGGVPVVRNRRGGFDGVEAVIDKDLASSIVATALGASTLAIVTDVPGVAIGFGRPWEAWLKEVRGTQLEAALRLGEFGAGSMRPKVEAALSFLNAGGRRAIVTDLPSLARAWEGDAGTQILAD